MLSCLSGHLLFLSGRSHSWGVTQSGLLTVPLCPLPSERTPSSQEADLTNSTGEACSRRAKRTQGGRGNSQAAVAHLCLCCPPSLEHQPPLLSTSKLSTRSRPPGDLWLPPLLRCPHQGPMTPSFQVVLVWVRADTYLETEAF